MRAQPFYRYVVHDALVAAGRADLIADACLDWTMALERCPTSWTETWYGGTVSHGWSSTPTRDLCSGCSASRRRRPASTSPPSIRRLGGLAWARGAVPTPAGLLRIAVDATDGIEIDSPIPFVHAGTRYEAGIAFAVTAMLLARPAGHEAAPARDPGRRRSSATSESRCRTASSCWPTAGTPKVADAAAAAGPGLSRTPYGRARDGLNAARLLAERGYQVVVVSCRGTFGSGGEFDPLFDEAADGRDVFAWLDEQAWAGPRRRGRHLRRQLRRAHPVGGGRRPAAHA